MPVADPVRRSRVLWPASLAVASGCVADAGRWQAWRDACDVPPGEHVAVPYDDESTYAPISEACARRLGGDVGLDWRSFDAEPRGFERAQNPAEWVIAGLYTLAAADLGTVGELRADLVAGELLSDELPEYDALWGFEDDEPAGRFWVAWLTHERIGSVYNRSDDPSNALAVSYYGDVGIVSTADELFARNSGTATGAMGVLVHEAAHWSAPPHDDGERDAGFDGAYGVEARILFAWRARYASTPEAAAADGLMSWLCNDRIVDTDGFPACESRPR